MVEAGMNRQILFLQSMDKPCLLMIFKQLLDEQAVENVRLEFKLERPDKDETLKKLSSFANTFGGYLIIGAKANSSDGILTGLPRESRKYEDSNSRLFHWCYGAASPPLEVFISPPIPSPD